MKIDEIKKIICSVFGINEADVFGKSKSPEFVSARYVFCQILYSKGLLRNKTAIGKLMDRDHSTVCNALKRHEDFNSMDRLYQKQYKQVLALVDKMVFDCEYIDVRLLFKRIDILKYCEPCSILGI